MIMNKLILNDSVKFEEAIKLLDMNGNGVLPVVDNENKFVGLITDGDIRKAILNKHLDLEHIINKHPHKCNVNLTTQQKIQILKSIRRRQLPIVDDNGFYVDIFTLDDLEFNLKSNPVVIMAGGLGARLGELTKDMPKPMLHVGEKPILETILENFIDHGFNHFYICVNYKSEKIVDYFGDGSRFGVSIKYVHESKRLGTAGGLSLIGETIKEPLIVVNGDVLTTLDFSELIDFHVEKKSAATMCIREYEYNIPYGVIESSGSKIMALKEKPCLTYEVNTGVYVLDPTVLKHIPQDVFFDMPDLFEVLLDKGIDIYTYKLEDYWIDVGHVDDYEKAIDDFNIDV